MSGKIINIFVLIFLISLLLTSMGFSETYAIVIASGEFNAENIVKLPEAIKDAELFKKALIIFNIVKKENIIFLKNPTLSQMKKYIIEWAKKAKNNSDKLIFYYSGHGYEKDGSTFLITYDTYPDMIEETSLDFTKFIAKIRSFIKTSKVVIIVDACYSGGILKDRPLKMVRYSKNIIEELSKNYIFLLSSKPNEVSLERSNGGGWFTYYLTKAMEGEADFNNDGYVDVSEIFRYISRKIPEATGDMQHPVGYGIESNVTFSINYKKIFTENIMDIITKEYEKGSISENYYILYTKILFQSPLKDDENIFKIRKALLDYYQKKISLNELLKITGEIIGMILEGKYKFKITDFKSKMFRVVYSFNLSGAFIFQGVEFKVLSPKITLEITNFKFKLAGSVTIFGFGYYSEMEKPKTGFSVLAGINIEDFELLGGLIVFYMDSLLDFFEPTEYAYSISPIITINIPLFILNQLEIGLTTYMFQTAGIYFASAF